MIEEAKRKATSANNTAANTMDKLNKIRKEIDKISVSPINANLSNDLNEVDQSGEFSDSFHELLLLCLDSGHTKYISVWIKMQENTILHI